MTSTIPARQVITPGKLYPLMVMVFINSVRHDPEEDHQRRYQSFLQLAQRRVRPL
jgi:hypothetical protein